MTTHRLLPSEIEPEVIGELIEDCRSLPTEALPRPRTVDVDGLGDPDPSTTVRIPESSAALMADLDDYV